MIHHLDLLLRHLFVTQVNRITKEEQIGFQPPDEEWRTHVANLTVDGEPANALNVYLFDLRENRKLRSNERVRSVTNDAASETPAPARLDCHYLISAWSPAEQSPATEPTVDEHRLLYGVTAVLMTSAPLKPAAIYGGDPSLKNNWGPFWDMELPTEVLPAEGFPKLAEFWGAMGANNRWKPVVYLVVTLPVAMPSVAAGPLVTTQVMKYQLGAEPMKPETTIHFGGQVCDSGTQQPIPDAIVEFAGVGLRTKGVGLRTKSDSKGHFSLSNVAVGEYTLRVTAVGYHVYEKPIQILAEKGSGIINLSPV